MQHEAIDPFALHRFLGGAMASLVGVWRIIWRRRAVVGLLCLQRATCGCRGNSPFCQPPLSCVSARGSGGLCPPICTANGRSGGLDVMQSRRLQREAISSPVESNADTC